jgi:predicted outer membrane protein
MAKVTQGPRQKFRPFIPLTSVGGCQQRLPTNVSPVLERPLHQPSSAWRQRAPVQIHSLRGAVMKTLIITSVIVLTSSCFAWSQRPILEPPSGDTNQAVLDRRDSDKAVEQQLASWLAMSHHANVELAKVAAVKSDNEAVRQLAQQMVKDHTSLLDDLKPFLPEEVEPADAEARNDTGTRAEEREIARQNHEVLLDVRRRSSNYELALTKQLFEKYEGQDFDMAYLGQQTVAHVQMMATLHAMKDYGSKEFQQIVAGGTETVKQHFQHVQALSKRLEDDRRTPSSE